MFLLGEDISVFRDEHDDIRISDMMMKMILFMKKNYVTNVRFFKMQNYYYFASLRLCVFASQKKLSLQSKFLL